MLELINNWTTRNRISTCFTQPAISNTSPQQFQSGKVISYVRRDSNSLTISSDLWSAWAVSFFHVAAVASFRPKASLNPCPSRKRNSDFQVYQALVGGERMP